MTSYKLVYPEHLNHFGYLFGGHLLKWVDEVSWMAASMEYNGCRFVTIAMDRVEFRKTAKSGAILLLETTREHVGTTSVTYRVDVFRLRIEGGAETEPMFQTRVTLVRVDESGRKQPLPEMPRTKPSA